MDGDSVRRIETLRWRLRVVDFALATMAAAALLAVGLAEVSWLPFATVAIAGERGRGPC